MLKKHGQLLFFFILVIIAFIYYKTIDHKIIFKRITLDNRNEIDTLERFHNDSLLLVDIIENGFLGRFSMRLGYIRNFGKKAIIYQSNIKDWQVSSNYLSITKEYEKRSISNGWYNVGSDGKAAPLKGNDKVEDSLRAVYNKDYHVSSDNFGRFYIYLNGKQIKQFNYGNLITNDSTTNFDSFEFGLYKLVNNHFISVSSNSEDLFKKGAGIFFVPKPGGDVIKKFKKSMMDSILMSFHSLNECPNRIAIIPD